jgi:hypothetical protein
VPGAPTDPEQVKPEAQSVSAVQVVLQAPLERSQPNGAQLAVVGLHCPALQADVVRLIPSGQLAGAQLVVVGLHCPALQTDVVTLVPPSGQLAGAQVVPAA